MLATLALTALVTLAPLSGLDRAQANPWAQWSTGSWVLYDIENSLSGPMTNKLSLTAVGETTFTCRDESTWEGGSSNKDTTVSLARMGYPHALPSGREVGREVVVVAGKSFECAVWSARFQDDGPWEVVAWVSPDFEHPLRLAMKGSMTIELKVDQLADFVQVGKRKFKGARYKGSLSYDGKVSKLTQWRSTDIPGGMLRSETRSVRDGMQVVHTTQVREFRGTKLD